MKSKLKIVTSETNKLKIVSTFSGGNLLISPPVIKTAYAGTSPDGSIYKIDVTIDGINTPVFSFTSLGGEGLGDVKAVDSYTRNSITYYTYVTDQGYFVNDTSDFSVQVSSSNITALDAGSYFKLLIGDASGGNYISSNGGETWSSRGYDLGENQVNEVIAQSVKIL